MSSFISSRQNPLVQNIVRLKKRKERDKQGCFLVEGIFENRRLMEAGRVPKLVIFCKSYVGSDVELWLEEQRRINGFEVVEVNESVFDKLSQREHPDGMLSVVNTWILNLAELEVPEAPIILVAEGIEKPGNLGAMMRCAEGMGVDALMLCDAKTDVFNPNVVRASRGAIFSLNVVSVSSACGMQWLRDHRVRVFVTSPDTGGMPWESSLVDGCAIVLGSEHDGLSEQWLDAEYEALSLPMRGCSDSLNVSMTAMALLYEVARQRDLQ